MAKSCKLGCMQSFLLKRHVHTHVEQEQHPPPSCDEVPVIVVLLCVLNQVVQLLMPVH